MNIILTCRESGERRVYENCRLLTDNLPLLHNKVSVLDGDWHTLNDSIQINIPSNECFRELTHSIELLELPLSIEKSLIRVIVGTEPICTFKKTHTMEEKWKDIIMHVRLYGGKIRGNRFVFQKSSSASAFVNRFCDLFI